MIRRLRHLAAVLAVKTVASVGINAAYGKIPQKKNKDSNQQEVVPDFYFKKSTLNVEAFKERTRNAHEFLKEQVVPDRFKGGNKDKSASLPSRPEFLASGDAVVNKMAEIRLRLEALDAQIQDPFGVSEEVDKELKDLFTERKAAQNHFYQSINLTLESLGIPRKEVGVVTGFLFRPQEKETAQGIYKLYQSYNYEDLVKAQSNALSAFLSDGFGAVVEEIAAYVGSSFPYRYENLYNDLPKVRAIVIRNKVRESTDTYLKIDETVSDDANQARFSGREAVKNYLFWNGISNAEAGMLASQFYDGKAIDDQRAQSLLQPFSPFVERIHVERERNKPKSVLLRSLIKANHSKKSSLTYREETEFPFQSDLAKMRKQLDQTATDFANFASKLSPFPGESEPVFSMRIQGYQDQFLKNIRGTLGAMMTEAFTGAAKRANVDISRDVAAKLVAEELSHGNGKDDLLQSELLALVKGHERIFLDPSVQKLLLAVNELYTYAREKTLGDIRAARKNVIARRGPNLEGRTLTERWQTFVKEMDKATESIPSTPALWGENEVEYGTRTFPARIKPQLLVETAGWLTNALLEEIDSTADEKTVEQTALTEVLKRTEGLVEEQVAYLLSNTFFRKGWDVDGKLFQHEYDQAVYALHHRRNNGVNDHDWDGLKAMLSRAITDAKAKADNLIPARNSGQSPPDYNELREAVKRPLVDTFSKTIAEATKVTVANVLKLAGLNEQYRQKLALHHEATKAILVGVNGHKVSSAVAQETGPVNQPAPTLEKTTVRTTGDIAADIRTQVKSGQPLEGVLLQKAEKNTLGIDREYVEALHNVITESAEVRGGFLADQAKLLLLHGAKVPVDEMAKYLDRSPELVALQVKAIEKVGLPSAYMRKVLFDADENMSALEAQLMGARTGKSQVMRMHFLLNWDIPQMLTNAQLSKREVMSYLEKIYDAGVSDAASNILR